jgi:hypothetical protein
MVFQMASYLDQIAGFSYGSPTSVGGVMTPMMAGVGASDPTSAFFQNGGAAGGDPWAGMRSLSPGGASGAQPGGVGGLGLGMNIPTFQLALGGLQTIGNLWGAWQANKLAKESFAFQKDFANTNLANQIQSYNTSIEDRARARTFTEGGSDADAQAYIDEHSLRRQ